MRNIVKILQVLGIAVIVLTAIRCDKDRLEDDLNISIDASQVEISNSPSFDVNVTISSEMPRSGVTIEYIVKGEIDNQVYYQRRLSSTVSDNKLIIYGLPRQLWCICTITVASKNKKDNVAAASFRVGFK